MGLSAETADKERKVFVLELLDEGAAVCENGRIWCSLEPLPQKVTQWASGQPGHLSGGVGCRGLETDCGCGFLCGLEPAPSCGMCVHTLWFLVWLSAFSKLRVCARSS